MSSNTANLTENSYWDSASKRYQLIEPPLSPCEEDLDALRAAVGRTSDPLNILQLGVTPALATLDWPEGSRLLAVDHSQQMIDEVWPGDSTQGPLVRRAMLKEWFEIDEPPGTFDLIIGDGALNNVQSLAELPQLTEQFARLLKPGGTIAQRIFVLPEKPGSPEELFAKLKHNAFDNPHIFRLQLAMSLQNRAGEGVELHDVWQYWKQAAPEMDRLTEETGWSRETAGMIELYRDQHACLYFPTVKQLVDVFSPSFVLREEFTPVYTNGACFPTLVFTRKPSPGTAE